MDSRAFKAVGVDKNPLKRGFYTLLAALLITAVSRIIGIGLGILTSPQIGVIQDQLYAAFTGTSFYDNLITQSPEFAGQFDITYGAVWDLIRFAGGYPSYSGLGSSILYLMFVLGSWLLFTLLTFFVASWLGAKTDFSRALGVFALAYTPVMLTSVEAIPGASVAWILIILMILIAKFFAAREVYKLQAGGSLAVIMLPYVIGMVIIIALLLAGAALGLNQVPYVDEILRTLRFANLIGAT